MTLGPWTPLRGPGPSTGPSKYINLDEENYLSYFQNIIRYDMLANGSCDAILTCNWS